VVEHQVGQGEHVGGPGADPGPNIEGGEGPEVGANRWLSLGFQAGGLGAQRDRSLGRSIGRSPSDRHRRHAPARFFTLLQHIAGHGEHHHHHRPHQHEGTKSANTWYSPDGIAWSGQRVREVFGDEATVLHGVTIAATTVLLVVPNGGRPITDPTGCPLNLYSEEHNQTGLDMGG
jgi:hypothetical protein